MQFATKEDIDAPIGDVFREVSNFAVIERMALRRGVEVRRLDDLPFPGAGAAWEARFRARGRKRTAHLEITEFTAPESLTCLTKVGGISATLVVTLIALSRNRTRISLATDLRASDLSSRLLLQSLKLARGTLTRRYHLRVAEYARDLQARLKIA